MILTDVFEVVVEGTCDGETANNVFYLQPSSFPGGLPPTGETETNNVLGMWVDKWVQILQSVDPEFSSLFVIQQWKGRMLFDPVSLYGGPVTGSPQVIGAGSNLVSPWASYSFYSKTKRRGQNGGHKRVAGVIEGAITNGTLVAGTVTSLNNEVADFLNNPVNVGVSLDYVVEFVVVNVKRIFVPGTSSHKSYYRLPENLAEYAGYIADNWIVQADSTTQNTRKRGRGS